jgi:ribosomal protein S6--L-glutamate ligase
MKKLSPALDFKSFLNEAEEKGMVDILMLSGESKPSKTAKSFAEECEKRGIGFNVVNVNNVVLEKVYNGHVVKYTQDEEPKEILIRPETTAIVPRRGVVFTTQTKQIMRDLEAARYFCVNSLESIEVCESKFLTSKVLEEEGLPVPRYALVTSEDSLDSALKKIGGEFPVVMKLLSGTQGIGVSVVDSYTSLKSVYQTINKLNPDKEILIQEKIDSDFDIRVQVIMKNFDPINDAEDNCMILGSMKRQSSGEDFRTNYSLGGSVSEFKIDEQIKKIACDAANAVGCHWCGVDIMIDSKTGNPYILEVNSSPGTEGISEAIGKPIVDDVIKYVADKKNWSFTKMEIGYLETIEIPLVGKMIAKFDTGNGSAASSIHADQISVDGKKVKWKIGDKNFESKLDGFSKTLVGDEIFERPIIKLDLVFAGVKIPNQKVALADRADKTTPFLANRKLMRKLGVMVNPNKSFVCSQKLTDYDPSSAKLEANGGIQFKKS